MRIWSLLQMRPTNVITAVRLLRWILRLVVRKNRNVSKTTPYRTRKMGSNADVPSRYHPLPFSDSLLRHRSNEPHDSSLWSIFLQLPVDSYLWRAHAMFRRSASLSKFKGCRFILLLGGGGGGWKLTNSLAKLYSTHMVSELVTNWTWSRVDE